ncbi:hypothetical protein [Gracilibacillus thailandensis]
MIVSKKKSICLFIVLLILLQACGTSDQYEVQSDINPSSSGEQNQTEDETFVPKETDVIFQNNELKNKEVLETFMETAGTKGNDNTSEIRVVKYFSSDNFIIYDLKSRYSEEADQRWIEVNPDTTYYDKNSNTQDVFNNAPQQCGWLEKDTTNPKDAYYKFFECRTNWEYRFLPALAGDKDN